MALDPGRGPLSQVGRTFLAPLLFVAGFALVLIAVRTHWSPVIRIDRQVNADLDRFGAAHPDWVTGWNALTTVMQPNVWRALAIGLVAFLFWKGLRDEALVVAGVVALAALASVGIKALIDRPRPSPYSGAPHAIGSSFPSGHALTATAIVFTFVTVAGRWGLLDRAMVRRAVVAVAAVLVALVSFSRLALGVHYLSDVVGGILAGAACATIGVTLARRTASRSPSPS